jgi:hypothetical protein
MRFQVELANQRVPAWYEVMDTAKAPPEAICTANKTNADRIAAAMNASTSEPESHS